MRRRLILGLAILATGGMSVAQEDPDVRREAIRADIERIGRNADGLSAPERLKRLTDLLFDYALLESPEFATMVGRPVGQDRWSDRSLEAIDRRKADARRHLDAIKAIDRAGLDAADRLNYDLLRRKQEQTVEGQRFPDELLPITQQSGLPQNVPDMLARMPTATLKDYEAILGRLGRIPTLVDQTNALMRKGLDTGVTPPKVTLREVPGQIERLLTEDPSASGLLAPFARFPSEIGEADRARLREEAARIYRDAAAPAFRKLGAFLADTYIPGARETIAARDLPDGAAWYAFDVKRMTTTDLTPRQIHDLGQSEVRRIRAEMERVLAETKFSGGLAEFFAFLRTDPRFFYDSADDLLRGYRDIAKRIDPELIRQFGRLPRLPYGVKPVPSYSERSATTAYYFGGSLDAGRPGTFFANTYDLKSRPKWEMEALTLHEAVPGHHLQIALAEEMEGLPWYRRYGGYSAFVEGWGLYAESLGGDLGLYRDPYSKFGQLTYEMWRAIRLVVDTGMHEFGWSRDRAINFFKENAGKAEHDIVVEVDRYIAWPGQALAYKVGELKIKELRARAERDLGRRFDVRAFHDAVLDGGALPLDVLEDRVGAWIKARKAEGR